MKSSKVLNVILLISGLIAIGVGGTILTMPVAFYSASGINIEGNISLLNEIRASGGALLTCGIVIALGAFVAKLTYTSVVISILLYLSYALSRILSIAVDGMPVEALVQAVILEIIIGLLCVFAFIKYNVKSHLN